MSIIDYNNKKVCLRSSIYLTSIILEYMATEIVDVEYSSSRESCNINKVINLNI